MNCEYASISLLIGMVLLIFFKVIALYVARSATVLARAVRCVMYGRWRVWVDDVAMLAG